ncbi:MAG: CPBP family intramembrane metalloprotease [Lachnospiraceae bacterium]|nr:CPBP family intramembrane metalloprotease [Lachnospiraceae bacterium]
MKKFWKKVGFLGLTVLPVGVSLIGQFLASLIVMLLYSMFVAFRAGMSGMRDPEQLQQLVSGAMMDSLPAGILTYHLAAVVIFGIWYYFGCGRPKFQSPARVFNLRNILVTTIMGLAMCLAANAMVLAATYVVPGVIEAYMEMAEAAGLGTDALTIIASVLVGPVGEEILCRGITFHYAGKVVCGMRNQKAAFWIANSLQALMFGVMHANLVQGTYAFFLGLCLGWLTHRYRSLYPAILAHMIVNFASTFLADPFFSLIPENFIMYLFVLFVGTVIILAAVFWDREKALKQ